MNGSKIAVVALALVLSAQRFPVAQGQPAEFMQVVTATVDLGMQAEFEDYIKKIAAAAAKVNAAQYLMAYQVVMGGSPGTYFIASPFENWAGADGLAAGAPGILMKAYGDVEGAKILKAGRATIASLDIGVSRLLPNLSTRPMLVMPPKAYLQIIRTEVDIRMQDEYRHYLSMLKAAQEKDSRSPTATRRISVAGPAAVFITTSPFDKFAERDAWPGPAEVLAKAYGEAEARMLQSQSLSAVRNRATYVARFRADLSRLPGAASND
jgi:hypothetical protein